MTTTLTLEQVMHSWTKSRMSKIIPKLTKPRSKKGHVQWRMQLVEEWPDEVSKGNSELDRYVEWTTNILQTWPATRLSWDMWSFKTKRDAEKFLTLYHLKWQ